MEVSLEWTGWDNEELMMDGGLELLGLIKALIADVNKVFLFR